MKSVKDKEILWWLINDAINLYEYNILSGTIKYLYPPINEGLKFEVGQESNETDFKKNSDW